MLRGLAANGLEASDLRVVERRPAVLCPNMSRYKDCVNFARNDMPNENEGNYDRGYSCLMDRIVPCPGHPHKLLYN